MPVSPVSMAVASSHAAAWLPGREAIDARGAVAEAAHRTMRRLWRLSRQRCGEGLEGAPLLIGQLGRQLDDYLGVKAAAPLTAQRRHALIAQAEDTAVLCPGGDLKHDATAVGQRYRHLAAQQACH